MARAVSSTQPLINISEHFPCVRLCAHPQLAPAVHWWVRTGSSTVLPAQRRSGQKSMLSPSWVTCSPSQLHLGTCSDSDSPSRGGGWFCLAEARIWRIVIRLHAICSRLTGLWVGLGIQGQNTGPAIPSGGQMPDQEGSYLDCGLCEGMQLLVST